MPDPTRLSTVSIRFEQAVYGSFPFWDKGYAILAKSPGCRREWLADFQTVCRRYGERPRDAAEAGGLLALKLPSGPWAVVRPSPQGRDDRGRPGALAFHAIFLSGSDYRRIGAFPFDLVPFLRSDWSAETVDLPAGALDVDHPALAEPTPPTDSHVAAIVAALREKRRVALEADGPIDDLARRVWLALPVRRRSRLSLATWTFAIGDRYDFAGLPKLAGISLDRSYVDPTSLKTVTPRLKSRTRTLPTAGSIVWLGFGAVILAALGFPWNHRDRSRPDSRDANAADPTDRPLSPLARRRIGAGLYAFAERFGSLDSASTPADTQPDALMERLRERLTYRGTLLTPDDLARLRSSADPDRDRCLLWHDQVARCVPDRPLPADFFALSLDRQLRTFAWSFHLDPADRPADQIPRFLSESLSIPVSIRSTPLADRYPALDDYRRFLRRLPIR